MIQTVEMFRDGDDWSVRVNGIKYIDRESFTIAGNVYHALKQIRDGVTTGHSECDEVADMIARTEARKAVTQPNA